MTARFITAPDKIPVPDPEEHHTKILILDSDWHDIEAIAFLCMTKQVKYDFYLFGPTSIDKPWLDNAAKEADFILINGSDTGRHEAEKAKFVNLENTVLMGAQYHVKAPLDFIVTQLEEE